MGDAERGEAQELLGLLGFHYKLKRKEHRIGTF